MKKALNKKIVSPVLGTSLVLGSVAALSPSQVSADGLTLSSMKPQGGGWTVATDAGTVLQRTLTNVIVVGALVALYYLIMGAIGWITSGGDKGKVEVARNKMIYAVVGLLILASVWAIYSLVLTLGFGTTNISPVSISG